MCGIKIPETLSWPTNKNDNNNTGLSSPHQAVWSQNLVWLHMNWITDLSFVAVLATNEPRLNNSAWLEILPDTHILPCKPLFGRVCTFISITTMLAHRKLIHFHSGVEHSNTDTYTFQQQPLSLRDETRAVLWSSQTAGVQYRCIPGE